MDKGRIEQIGTPEEIYNNPASVFVHEFIGESIALPVVVADGVLHLGGSPTALRAQNVRSGRARLFVRPTEMSIGPAGSGSLFGQVKRIHGLGGSRRIEIALRTQADVFEIAAPPDQHLLPGQEIGLTPRRFHVFPEAA